MIIKLTKSGNPRLWLSHFRVDDPPPYSRQPHVTTIKRKKISCPPPPPNHVSSRGACLSSSVAATCPPRSRGNQRGWRKWRRRIRKHEKIRDSRRSTVTRFSPDVYSACLTSFAPVMWATTTLHDNFQTRKNGSGDGCNKISLRRSLDFHSGKEGKVRFGAG